MISLQIIVADYKNPFLPITGRFLKSWMSFNIQFLELYSTLCNVIISALNKFLTVTGTCHFRAERWVVPHPSVVLPLSKAEIFKV